MPIDLSLEQQFTLNKISIEIQNFSREELIVALLDSREARFRLKAAFLDSAREAGFNFKLNEGTAIISNTACDEFEAENGYAPSVEEAEEIMQNLFDEANMELDMYAIVLESEE